MTWENVPWMVNNAFHSAEVGRVLAYLATGRSEGIVGPEDCKVTANSIPNATIHIAPGAVGCLNRGEGGDSQAYVLRNVGDEVAALTPQGASGVRYDLVAVVVKDPQYAGQPAPPDVEDGPYLETRIYPDVPSTTKNLFEVDADQTGVALALVKFDASDGTINPADITDLRVMLKPERHTEKRILNGVPNANIPSSPGVMPPGASWEIQVPLWATHVQLEARWSGLQFVDASGTGNGQSQGIARVALGPLQSSNTQWLVDGNGANKPVTDSTMAAEELNCVSYQGQVLSLEAILDITSQVNMTGRSTPYTTVVVEATFLQRAI